MIKRTNEIYGLGPAQYWNYSKRSIFGEVETSWGYVLVTIQEGETLLRMIVAGTDYYRKFNKEFTQLGATRKAHQFARELNDVE